LDGSGNQAQKIIFGKLLNWGNKNRKTPVFTPPGAWYPKLNASIVVSKLMEPACVQARVYVRF